MSAMLMLDWRLALVAFAVLPLIALVTQWFRVNVRDTYRDVRLWIARINAYLQEHLTGHGDRAAVRPRAAQLRGVRGDQRRPSSGERRVDLLLRGVLPGDRDRRRAGHGAAALVRRRPRRAGCAQPRDARRLHPVRAALLPPDSGPVGEVQHPAGRDGLVRADLPVAGYAGGDRAGGSGRSGRQAGQECRRSRRASADATDRPTRPTGASRASPSTTSGSPTTTTDYVLRDVSFTVEPGERIGIVGAHRGGQDDGHQSAAAVLRRDARADHGGWRRHPRVAARSAARPLRPRAAGRPPVLGHDRRKHPARPRGLHRRRRARRAARGECRHVRRGARRRRRAPVVERAATLSVGQKQLLSFARALAAQPAACWCSTKRRRASIPRPSG